MHVTKRAQQPITCSHVSVNVVLFCNVVPTRLLLTQCWVCV